MDDSTFKDCRGCRNYDRVKACTHPDEKSKEFNAIPISQCYRKEGEENLRCGVPLDDSCYILDGEGNKIGKGICHDNFKGGKDDGKSS